MDANPYQPPTTPSESPSRTDISFVEGLAYCLGWIALRTVVFLFFAALVLGIVLLTWI